MLALPRLRGERRRDENSSGKIWEGAADGRPRWIRGCICNTARSALARRGGGDEQSIAYILEDNRVMPSHQHILASRSLWAIIDRSVTKGECLAQKGGRGRKIRQSRSWSNPLLLSLCERLGGTLQAAFSFHCIRVCLLVGAGWQAPLVRRSAVQMPS